MARHTDVQHVNTEGDEQHRPVAQHARQLQNLKIVQQEDDANKNQNHRRNRKPGTPAQREQARELVHRLALLGVPWAALQRVSGKAGTFHELWELKWTPEIEVQLVEAGLWGTTVESAAGARARHDADAAVELEALAELLDRAILAELPDAIERLLTRVQDQAAVSADVLRLMAALPALARTSRYGDVRGTPGARIRPVIDALFDARPLPGGRRGGQSRPNSARSAKSALPT